MSHLLHRILCQLAPPIFSKGGDRLVRFVSCQFSDHHVYRPRAWEDHAAGKDPVGWNAEGMVEAERSRWEAFLRNASGAGPLGFSHEYEDPEVRDSVYFHNVHMTFGYTLALAAWRHDRISVLDHGGSLGHYALIAKALLPDLGLDYHVKEVPRMAAMGRKLNPGVTWHEDDTCLARAYDLIVSNGSLDYIRDWKGCLAGFGRSARGYVMITRVKTIPTAPTCSALHCTPYGNIPHWLINERELLETASAAGLVPIRELVVGDHVPTRGAPDRCVLKGWLFKKDPT